MNKKNRMSRSTERVGWFVTLMSFVCGAAILYEYQEESHRVQLEDLVRTAQHSTPILIRTSVEPVEVLSKTLPPSGSEVGHAFWVQDQREVMQTEVTVDIYNRLLHGKEGERVPMLFSNVQEVQDFADALSSHQGLESCYTNKRITEVDCSGWRIPTDNEWMLFASAGQGTKYAGSDVFLDVGWNHQQSYEVASKPPNKWGLYDMSGGAKELVWDRIHERFGLLGDEGELKDMSVQPLEKSFSVRLLRHSYGTSSRMR